MFDVNLKSSQDLLGQPGQCRVLLALRQVHPFKIKGAEGER
jgi:hypothetical protein